MSTAIIGDIVIRDVSDGTITETKLDVIIPSKNYCISYEDKTLTIYLEGGGELVLPFNHYIRKTTYPNMETNFN